MEMVFRMKVKLPKLFRTGKHTITKMHLQKRRLVPRIGLAFPISANGVVHFSYGHFLQLPRYEYLYENPRFKLGVNSGNAGLFGNSDLEPQKTVKGEIGYTAANW